MIEHIRGIGSNPAVLAETVAKVREDSKRCLSELETEQRAARRELKTLNTRVKKLVSESFGTESNKSLAPDIQENLLFLPRTLKGYDPIREKDMRPIAAVAYWQRQRKMWAKLAAQGLK